VTLHEGPRPMNSNNLIGRNLYIGPKAFKERSKTKKWQIEAKPNGTFFGRKINWLRPKNSSKRRAPDFKEPRIRLGTKVQSNSRIQFASNQSKLVPRKLDSGPLSKVGLRVNTRMTFLLTMELT